MCIRDRGVLGELHRDLLAGEVGPRRQRIQRALELADIGMHALGEEEGDILGQLHAALAGLGQHDLRAGLEVRRIDRHRQPGAQTRFQPRLQPCLLYTSRCV